MYPRIHSPKSTIDFLKLLTKLNKKHKGKSFSDKDAIIVSIDLMNDICSSLIDMQNRIDSLEKDND